MSSSPHGCDLSGVMQKLSPQQRRRGLLLILALGLALFLWQLGSTGLVDETPPLFAAAGRAMTTTGDWLTPRVNGLPRFDKPPLVYWLMGMFYSLPGHDAWDPLGTWAARLPSALAALLMMLALGDTVMLWPQSQDSRARRTAVAVALAFALSPLVMLWSRIAVSDALLCGTLGVSLLLQWRRFAAPSRQPWWLAWVVLGLAVLTKGPVAVVLSGLVLILFAAMQWNLNVLWQRLRPLPGLLITALISLPWYGIELLVEGQPFWDSFFGYHNLQRFTSVVNSHLQPWWYFGPVLLVASLPFSPLLILGLMQSFVSLKERLSGLQSAPEDSLQSFATCWLLGVLLLFTSAATKLPSYWLPATPAAALLIGLAASASPQARLGLKWAWAGSIGLALVLAAGFWASPLWLPQIYDPEMPSLATELLASRFVLRAAVCFSVAGLLGVVLAWQPRPGRLLAMQGPLVLFHLLAILPMWALGDRVRQLPVRQVAELMLTSQKAHEPLVMVGAMKPSLHFYTDQVVVYEGRSDRAFVNLADRLQFEKRQGWIARPIDGPQGSPTMLMVIDQGTAKRRYWQDLQPEKLGEFGVYRVWRLSRRRLEQRAQQLRAEGTQPNWRRPRPERF
ncbi:MAG: glycosyltransferase family 39 protein [Prochlorococcus sp.]|nr:glycosyltransferase family 39 protein [Prochlorococcus sp.]